MNHRTDELWLLNEPTSDRLLPLSLGEAVGTRRIMMARLELRYQSGLIPLAVTRGVSVGTDRMFDSLWDPGLVCDSQDA